MTKENSGLSNVRSDDLLAQLISLHDGKLCPRCKCCEMFWQECEYCGGEGLDGHDCGEDTCCCLDPEDNMTCDMCGGTGGFWHCDCDKDGKHKSG